MKCCLSDVCDILLCLDLITEVIYLCFVCLFFKLEGQVVALMVQNMERLDETVKEEADGVHNTLGTWCKIQMKCE